MKKHQKRKLSLLIAIALVLFTASHMVPAYAEPDPGHQDVVVSGITYSWDGFVYVGLVGSSFAGTAISVPEDYHLIMGDTSDSLNGVTVSIATGGSLEIFDDKVFEGTITPSDGAFLRFGSAASVPAGITLYDASGAASFTGNVDPSVTFCYNETLLKWVRFIPPFMDINIGGFNAATDTISVSYKYTGETDYRVASDYAPEEDPGFPGNYSGTFELAGIPNQWDCRVDVKITLSSTRSIIMAAADCDSDDLSSYISPGGTEFNTIIDLSANNWVGISLAYPNSGNPDITEEANNNLYAYYAADQDGVKALFAEELICRLMDPSLFEYFGMPETTDASSRSANVATLLSRIQASGSSYTVTAKDPGGADHTITVQDYNVNWGNNFNNGQPVVSTLPVYTLENVDQVLICTDFNDRTGRGNNFLICDIDDTRDDETDFINFSNGAEERAGGVCFTVTSINPATIKCGGMGRFMTRLNEEGLYTIEVNGGAPASFLRVTNPVRGGGRIRLLKSSEKYLAIGGEGETKAYGLIGDAGSNVDPVWTTGNNRNAKARVYVGDSTIHLYPLVGSTGLSQTGITSVELVEPSQTDGVTLNASDLSDISLSFSSNFYDEIPLKFIFEGGAEKYITVVRVGLVIQYQYLGGDPDRGLDDHGDPIVDHGEIIQDYQNTTISYDYSYFNGEQIAVWATYYHPTSDHTGGASDYMMYLTFNNGTHRVISASDTAHSFNGRIDATSDEVASTTFLIGFEQAREYFDGNVWIGQRTETTYHEGGFYATVLNAGFDDNTTYSGTQMGSGKGVYWDGHISFYR